MRTDVGIYSVTSEDGRYYIAAVSVDHALGLWREAAPDDESQSPEVNRIPISETKTITTAPMPPPESCTHCRGTGIKYAPQETLRKLWDDFQEMGRPWGTGDVLWSSRGAL